MSEWKNAIAETPVVRWLSLPDIPEGQLVRLSFFSPALGLRRFVGLYKTSGPPVSRIAPPIIYLFRGHYTEWLNSSEDESRTRHSSDQSARNFLDLLQEAVDAGELPGCLVVFPDFAGDSREGLTLAVDWKEPRRARSAGFIGGGMGRFETSFREDFLPKFEEKLGVFNPRRKAIGFSLGGLNAVQLALRNPLLFQVVAAYDGSFPFDPVQESDSILAHQLFDPIFGRPSDRAQLKSHSPVWLAKNLPEAQLRRMKFFLASGPERAEPGDSNFYRTRDLVTALQDRGVCMGMEQVIDEGHHDWYTADRFALQVLRSTQQR